MRCITLQQRREISKMSLQNDGIIIALSYFMQMRRKDLVRT